MLSWCPQPTLIFSWLLLPFCCCFFCGCAPLGTVAASLCCSPSTYCCVVRAGKERRESEKQNRKERSSGRKGKEEAGCPKMESENVSSPFFLQTETKESDRQGHGRKKKRGRQVSCCRQRRRVAEKHTALSHIHTFFTGKGKRGGDGGTLTLSLFPCSFPPLPYFSPGWLAQQWIVKTKGSWHSLSLTRYSRSHIIEASRQP